MKVIDYDEIRDKYVFEIDKPQIRSRFIDELADAQMMNQQYAERLEFLINREGYDFIIKNKKSPEFLILNSSQYKDLLVLFKELIHTSVDGFRMFKEMKLISSPDLYAGQIIIK